MIKSILVKMVKIEDYLVIVALVLAGITMGALLATKTPVVSANYNQTSSVVYKQ